MRIFFILFFAAVTVQGQELQPFAIKYDNGSNIKFGFMNEEDKEVIPAKYDDAL